MIGFAVPEWRRPSIEFYEVTCLFAVCFFSVFHVDCGSGGGVALWLVGVSLIARLLLLKLLLLKLSSRIK